MEFLGATIVVLLLAIAGLNLIEARAQNRDRDGG
jgi:hypothetical protein